MIKVWEYSPLEGSTALAGRDVAYSKSKGNTHLIADSFGEISWKIKW